MKKIDIKKIINFDEINAFDSAAYGKRMRPLIAYWIDDGDAIEEMTKDCSLEKKLALIVEGL